MESNRHRILFALLLCLLPFGFLTQLFFGSVNIPATEVLKILAGISASDIHRTIVLENRLPGAIAAVVAGASLSVSGLQMQVMFRNPVAGPYILGISSGSSLGVALLLMGNQWISHIPLATEYLNSPFSVAIAAAVGAAMVFVLIYLISFSVVHYVSLLIIGLMLGSAISAIIELLQTFSEKEQLQKFVLWGFASFRHLSLNEAKVMCLFCGGGLILSVFLIPPLQALLGGEIFAETVGVNVASTKRKIIIATAILAGTVTAFCGPIAFVGLAVPHICRSIFLTNNSFILTFSCMLVGALVCCVCNVAASIPGSEGVLPLNTITSLLGAPLVIYIIVKKPAFS
jgi:iron complex transport system permease protein